MDEHCTICGKAVGDHALVRNAAGIVVAGSYHTPHTFVICVEALHPAPRYHTEDRVYITGGPWAGQEGTVAYAKYSAPHGEDRRWRYEIRRRGYHGVITVDEHQLKRLGGKD